jgi:hypothetical protein
MRRFSGQALSDSILYSESVAAGPGNVYVFQRRPSPLGSRHPQGWREGPPRARGRFCLGVA